MRTGLMPRSKRREHGAQEDGRARHGQNIQVGDRILGRGFRHDRRHAQDRAMQVGHRLLAGTSNVTARLISGLAHRKMKIETSRNGDQPLSTAANECVPGRADGLRSPEWPGSERATPAFPGSSSAARP